MKKSLKMKVGLGITGTLMVLGATSAIGVSAFGKGQTMGDKQQVVIDGPYFYELDGKNIKTSYKAEKSELLRYQKELTSFNLGQSIRTLVKVENPSTNVQKFKLITVLEDINNKQDDILKMSDISELAAHEERDVYVDVKIPDAGNYNFKVYMWDDVNGMKALKDTTILANGASNLTYQYDGQYNRDAPRIVLNWKGCANAESYDVYVENKLLTNVKDTSYTLDLQPYTPYKISIQARLKDGKLATHSNTLYFMTEDTIASQEKRMGQWEDDRFGMMITYGGYAAFGGVYQGKDVNGNQINYDSAGGGNGAYAEWIKFGAGIPDDIYKKTVEQQFTAENYRPDEWVRIAKDAGMKYIVLITKHHEGMTLFNTAAKNGWSVQDTQAKLMVENLEQKDFLKQLIFEAEKEGIKVGAYYSQALDWAQPGSFGWNPQRQSKWSQTEIEKLKKDIIASGISEDVVNQKIYDILGGGEYANMEKMNNEVILTQVEELMTMKVNVNGKDVGIDTLWWDMGQKQYPEFNYEIMKKVVELDPEKKIKMNNRVLHEEKYSTMPFDYVTPEQSIPHAPESKYWETCMTMNTNWGYAKNDHHWKQADELVNKLSKITSMGGNFLLNVGPKPDADFPQESKDLLAQVGDWMNQNSEAIYGTSESPFLNTIPYGYATQKENKVYLHVYDQNYLNQLIIPGLKSQPKSIKVLTDKDTYQDVNFVRIDNYKGYKVEEAITPTNNIATIVVLEFDQTPEFEKCDEALPVMQDALTHHAIFKPATAKIVGNTLIAENNGENFGSWNNENDYAKWNFSANQAGLYSIDVNYATPLKGSVYILLKDKDGNILDEVRTQFGPSAQQDQWVTYKKITMGSLHIPASGNYIVEVHRDHNGPSDISVDNGPINIKSIEIAPLSEYGLTTQNLDQTMLNQDGLRSTASGNVHSEVSYQFKGHINWKLNINNKEQLIPVLTLASGDKDVKIKVSIKDNQGEVVNGKFIETTLKTPSWELKELAMNDVIDFTGLSGDYWLDVQVLEGEMNFKQIKFISQKQLTCDVNNPILLHAGHQNITLKTNIPAQCSVSNNDLVDIEKVSEKEYKITAKAKKEGSSILTLSSIDDSSNKIELPITLLDGNINTTKSTKIEDQDTPSNFSVINKNGSLKLEQDIQDAVKAEGKGIYKLEIIYKTPVNTRFAIGFAGDWYGADLATDSWTRTHTYFDLKNYVDGEIVIKPFDNFNGLNDNQDILISSVSFKKVGNTNELVQNATLSSEYIDRLDRWNRDQINCHMNIQLKAHQVKLLNVETPDKTNNIEINVGESPYIDYGKLGNWWDVNDQFSWDFEVKQTADFILNAKAKRNFKDCPIHIVIKDQNSQEVYNNKFTVVENITTYDLINNLHLEKGQYTIIVDRLGTSDDQVPDFYGFDLKENKISTPIMTRVLTLLDRFKKYNG